MTRRHRAAAALITALGLLTAGCSPSSVPTQSARIPRRTVVLPAFDPMFPSGDRLGLPGVTAGEIKGYMVGSHRWSCTDKATTGKERDLLCSRHDPGYPAMAVDLNYTADGSVLALNAACTATCVQLFVRTVEAAYPARPDLRTTAVRWLTAHSGTSRPAAATTIGSVDIALGKMNGTTGATLSLTPTA